MRRLLSILFMLLAVNMSDAQNVTDRKLSEFNKIVVTDSLQVNIHNAKKNHVAVTGSSDNAKDLVIKSKKGTLYIYENQKAQIGVDGNAVVRKKDKLPSIDLYINTRTENIIVSGKAVIKFVDAYCPKRLIIRMDKDSKVYGNISCEAFGLFLKSGAEAFLDGKFRTTKISVDSSKVEFTSYVAENSEMSVTGGSLLSAEGSTRNMDLKVSGLSRFDALRLTAKSAKADISGNSDVFFNASETLDITAKERSHIIVTGTPKTTSNVTKDCKFGRR